MYNFSWPLAELANLSRFAAQWEQQKPPPSLARFQFPFLIVGSSTQELELVRKKQMVFLTENFTGIGFSSAEGLELKENPFSGENGFEM